MQIRIAIVFLIAAPAFALAGCGSKSNEATKLDTPDGIDWEAIESQGGVMDDAQKEGE